MKKLPFIAVAVVALALTGCAGLSAAWNTATSASVTRNEALSLADATQTLEDLATSVINGCVATKSTKGVCAPAAVTAVHKALVATRQPRNDLLDFADTHAGKELGASGLYDALAKAKDALVSVLAQYGVTIPSNAQ